jgi:purine-binding chemotaxis protein CheW
MTTTVETRPNDAADAKMPRGGKFLTFFLNKEEYGVEILKVQEIIGLMPITPVPCVVGHIKGVVNLRGKIIPILDLRLKLALSGASSSEQSCIIVVQSSGLEMGMIVDKVSEVVDVAAEAIGEATGFHQEVDHAYLLGIAKLEGRVTLLLDLNRVLTPEDANVTTEPL